MVICRYGENLLNLEAVALESIQDCIQNMQNYNSKPFDPKKDIYGLTVDIMAQLVSYIYNKIKVNINNRNKMCRAYR